MLLGLGRRLAHVGEPVRRSKRAQLLQGWSGEVAGCVALADEQYGRDRRAGGRFNKLVDLVLPFQDRFSLASAAVAGAVEHDESPSGASVIHFCHIIIPLMAAQIPHLQADRCGFCPSQLPHGEIDSMRCAASPQKSIVRESPNN